MAAVRRVLWAVLVLAVWPAFAAETFKPHPLDKVLGKPDAKLTIIEYASLTCGHCANFHKTVLPRLKAEWIDTGKARLVYRDYPTGPANFSLAASMIAHCSGPDRYFPLLGHLFEQQEKWLMAKDGPLYELKRIAKMAGMDDAKVDACLKRQDLFEDIQTRAIEGSKAHGIESTPTLIIDGKSIKGVEDYEVYDKALKAAKK